MESEITRAEQRLWDLVEESRAAPAKGTPITRRSLLRSIAGSSVVTVVGLSGLLELLANREAIADGFVIVIEGITREPDQKAETPHRHSFQVGFRVEQVSPQAIMGDVYGRTDEVYSTGSVKEDDHFHVISAQDWRLENLLESGTEDNKKGGHTHLVSIE